MKWIKYVVLVLFIAAAVWRTAQIRELSNDVNQVAESVNALQTEQDALQLKSVEVSRIVMEPQVVNDKPQRSLDLLTPCGMTAQELQSALNGELKQYAAHFLTAEQDTEVNAIFLASVAALESGWGAYPTSGCNLYGWTGSSGYVAFESPQECIDYVARELKENYLSVDGIYYEGFTVDDVNVHYNGRMEWTREVCGIMEMIVDSGVDV